MQPEHFRCSKCLWWDDQHSSLRAFPDGVATNLGYCRKHKPVIYSNNNPTNIRYYGSWPLVDRNDFCGEYREDELQKT